MNKHSRNFKIEKAKDQHLDILIQLEKQQNVKPQSAKQFLKELNDSTFINLITCVSPNEKKQVYMGFCAGQIIGDELHIYSLIIDQKYRRNGFGNLLIRNLIEQAKLAGVNKATLEVRLSNKVAISLYEALGFTTAGVRKNYYIDNHEDALIMWLEAIKDIKNVNT
ncbi:MAG: ribosomal protein S18-alanine N-acetyltransferase [Acidimicrobiia bacterium]|nr:ribosomal protein S18-alanine N-acetyltransferase [Acidimicrobiia bacterium]